MLSWSTLLLLAVAWAVVLVPRAVRDVRSSPSTTVTGFNDAMARLAVCDQRLLVVPTGSGRRLVVHPPHLHRRLAVRRRRVVLVRLLVASVTLIAVAVVVGGWVAWTAAAVIVATLLVYCVALRRLVGPRVGSATVVPLHPSIAARRRRVERAAAGGTAHDATPLDSVHTGPVVPRGRPHRIDDVPVAARVTVDDDDGLLFGRADTGRPSVFERRPVLVADGG